MGFREMLQQKKINEEVEAINESGIGSVITYAILMVGQFHIWHLISPSGQKHMALGEFYTGLQEEVDSLAEKFLAQGGMLGGVSLEIITTYDEDVIIQNFKEFRDYITQRITTNPEMASINDGLIDLQELIDAKLYKFKLI